jgi:hypothetical protein
MNDSDKLILIIIGTIFLAIAAICFIGIVGYENPNIVGIAAVIFVAGFFYVIHKYGKQVK